MATIYDASGRPVRPVFGEVAAATGGRDITRPYVGPLLIPQDTVLQDLGQDWARYEELLRDDQVKSCFQQRRLAVVSREWEVVPGGERRADRKAADFLREVLERIDWDGVTDKMLYGLFYGFAVAECLWARDGAYVTLDRIKVRKQRRFRFAPDGWLRLLTVSNPMGEPVPARKFWWFSTGADNDDEPYGLGLAHHVYWPVFFKRHGIRFWMVFLEKFGMPTAKGSYPSGATEEEKRRLLEALAAIQTDSAVIVPESMQVDLIEAARRGTVDYNALCDRMDAAIAKVILSQTMTTDPGSSRAQAQVHMEVRDEVVKADADLVCQSFNQTVARWITEWNFPGAAVPQVWRKVEPEQDMKTLAERDDIVARHAPIPYRYWWETYGIPEPADGEPATQPAAGAPAGTEPAFAEADRRRAERVADEEELAAGAEALAGEWERLLGRRVERLIALAEETGDLATFRERLAELLDEDPPAREALARAGFTANLLGRLRAQKARRLGG